MEEKLKSIKLLTGTFTEEEHLLDATRQVREKGFTVHDTYTPYPVHGLDEAMGIESTRLPKLCFLLGLIGFIFAFSFEIWTFGYSWPMIVGGKSILAGPALVPVAFEVLVLFAAIGTVLAFFIRTGLKPGKKLAINTSGITNDQFVIAVKIRNNNINDARKILLETGAVEVHEIEVNL